MAPITDIFCSYCGELMFTAAVCPACGKPRPTTTTAAGGVLWRVDLGRALPSPRCYPVIAAGHLCLPIADGAVVGLQPAKGEQVWTYQLPEASAVYSLATDGQRVFVGAYDTEAVPSRTRRLVAINGSTGAEVWSYDGKSHSYSGPAFQGDTVFVTTATEQIHALDAATGTLRWSAPHPDWAPPSPAVAEHVVVTGGRGDLLVAYDIADGRELWRFTGGGWFATRPTVAAGMVLARCWDGWLYALDLQTGTLRWKVKGERGQGFSSPPAAGPDLVVIGDRVTKSDQGSYALRAFDASDGQERWRCPLPRHVSALPRTYDDLILCPCEDQQLYALDATSGELIWQTPLAGTPTARPLVYEGTAYVSDHTGGVYAVRLRQARDLSRPPDELVAAGDLEAAAAAFVLNGDPIAGALMYGRRLGKPAHAARIYEHINLPGQAAIFWEQAGDHQRACDAYKSAGDQQSLAAYLARTGETLEAARLYERLGNLVEAAALYEQAGDKAHAAEVLQQAGEFQRARQVAVSQDLWDQQIKQLIAEEQPADTAALLADRGQFERAAELFEQAGKLADALLLRLDLKHWAKAAELALRVGDLANAADAYIQLDQKHKAAELYEQAAKNALAADGPDDRLVADLYAQAAALYEEVFDTDRVAACTREVRRYRKLPDLQASLLVEQDFVEQEWNTATVELNNVGFGPARSIQVRPPLRFELGGATLLAGLPPQREARLIVSLRSRPNEIGQRVPIELDIAYLDTQDAPYNSVAQSYVRVLPRGVDPSRVTPEPTPTDAVRSSDEQPEEVTLTIRFEVEHDAVNIIWDSSVIGVRESKFVPPFGGAALDLMVRALDLLQFPSASLTPDEGEQLAGLGLPVLNGLLSEEGHRAVGRALFKALVADPRGAEALSTVRNYAQAEGRPLALRLHFPPDAIELAALPWELLWDDSPAPVLLGRRQLAGCTRHLDLPDAIPPPRRREGPLRILAITPHAGIDAESRERERAERTAAWGPLIASGDVVMEEISPATRRLIGERLTTGPTPDIIHFVGHGRYAEGEGWLVIDGPDGNWDRVPASRLMPFLGETRLVVLCACEGAKIGDGGLLTGVAPAFSAAGVPAVVAMQLTVRATAATRFTEVMYKALARGESLQRAVVQARQILYFEEQEGTSWYVPTVTIRARDHGPLYLFGAA